MNKKTLFSVLLAALVLPAMAGAVKTPTEMADAVKGLAVTIGGAIVVIGWIIAGILYLTAGGAPEKVKTAKGAMVAAVIGTILIVIATMGYAAIAAFLRPITG